MAITLANHVAAGSSGGGTFTTAAIDTTGSTLLVAGVASYDGAAAPILSDSKSNTWTGLTVYDPGGGNSRVQIFYATNVIIGAGHTFTVTNNGANAFASIAVMAFTGAHPSTPFDAQSGATSVVGVQTLSPGSITPFQPGEVFCTFISHAISTSNISIGSSFVISDTVTYLASNHFDISGAYLASNSAQNPAWSWTTNSIVATDMATFKSTIIAAGKASQGIMFF